MDRAVEHHIPHRLAHALLIAVLLLTACQVGPAVTPTPTGPVAATPAPTSTPTPQPLGSSGNPVILGIVSVDGDPEAAAASKELALRLTVQSGYAIQTRVFPSYPELLKEMKTGAIHFAWLPPLTYLLANQEGYAEVGLLSNHFGVFFYGTQFFVNADSGIPLGYNQNSEENLAEAQEALLPLQDKLPCWVDKTSLSGYIVPAGILAELGINVQEGVITQNATSLIRSLYIKGVCDFGATFAYTGDPRTASAVQADLPDVDNRVVVLWRSDAMIPSANLSHLPNLPEPIRETVHTELMILVKTEEGKHLLSQAVSYDIQDLRVVDDSVYDPIRGAVTRTNTKLNDVIGK